jgi:DNA-binding NarL/FixJ family response regulator
MHESYLPSLTLATPISILLADDHTMMREGTRKLLEEDPALKVVGEAQDGAEAIAFCARYQPSVVILDISMKGINGFGVARALCPTCKSSPALLVLTAYDQAAYVRTMLKLGAVGYWLKSACGNDIRQAVHEVAAKRQSLAPEVRRILAESEELSPSDVEPLTARELEVLQLVVQGARNVEIGLRLSISIKTVETHLTSLYSKLGVQSRAEAMALAQRQQLLLQ